MSNLRIPSLAVVTLVFGSVACGDDGDDRDIDVSKQRVEAAAKGFCDAHRRCADDFEEKGVGCDQGPRQSAADAAGRCARSRSR